MQIHLLTHAVPPGLVATGKKKIHAPKNKNKTNINRPQKTKNNGPIEVPNTSGL